MNHHALRRLKPLRQTLLHVFTALLTLTTLVPSAQTVQAQTICTLTSSGPSCPSYSPPELLNVNYGLYAATPAQTASIQNLESQAVSNIIKGHQLPAGDADAVKSWGRTEALAELYGLLLQAINASSPTTDQKNAVDWLTTVAQRQAVAAAQDAGLEYVKWAGLDESTYQSLLRNNATESDLQTFLSGAPDNYNLQPLDATGGWCVYHPPAPYTSEYMAAPIRPATVSFASSCVSRPRLTTTSSPSTVRRTRTTPC